MAGTIAADTLTHSTAGSLTTDYVVNGSAKAWVNFNGSGTVAIRDSFSTASITDVGTGEYTVNLSNTMANADYASNGSASADSAPSQSVIIMNFSPSGNANVAPSTTATRVAATVIGASKDAVYVHYSVHGDLA